MLSVVTEKDPDKIDSAAEALEYDFLNDSEENIEEIDLSDLIVPYHHNLKKTLVVKSNILVNGFVPPTAQRFAIDLCTHLYDKFRNKKTKEIVFHFNPRFGQNCVVRNSYVNGEWGLEEVHTAKKNPFKRGHMFIMEIYVLKTEYLVSVNGVHFCSFSHRIHPSSVDSIDISGDVQLLKVELSVREMYPSTESTLFLVDDPLHKMKFPFFHEFKYPLMERWDLRIIGTVMDYADRFAVDLCGVCDKCSKPHKNIIFHFNPRLSQNYVARNSFLHELWGTEESHAIKRSPFKRGSTFTIEVFVTDNQYLISVNGRHFCNFQHRIPPSYVDSIEIHGDVALKRVDISRKDHYPSEEENLYPNLDNYFLEKLPQPVTYRLSDPLSSDTIIEIKGRVLMLPTEFYVNLQNGNTTIPHPVIPYHLSMRWRPLGVDSIVVNSWITGHWDEEVIFRPLLRPNSSFMITIYVQKEGFSTVVKAPIKPYSIVLPLFVYRTDLNIIDTIHIQGDVQIHSIIAKKISLKN